MSKSTAKGWFTQTLAEFLGTAMCMYVSVGGADAVAEDFGVTNSYLGKSFAFGIGLAVTAWAFFRISGSHFNPAVSFSSLITGHLTAPKFVLYFVAQLLGAMLGVALARGTTPASDTSDTLLQINSIVSFFFYFCLKGE
jgi:aquaporin related protein